MAATERTNKNEGNLREMPSRRFSVIHVHDGFAYETHRVMKENMRTLRLRAFPFEQLLGYDVFRTPDEIRHHIQPRPNRLVQVVFVRTLGSNARDVAVVTQEVADVSAGEDKKRVLSIGVKAVSPDFQDRDIGSQLLIDGILENDVDIITGQSRNGRVYRYLEKTPLIKKTLSLDGDFTPEVPEVLRQVLDKTTFRRISDFRTGLCLGIYPPADSKLFIAPKNNEAAVRVVNRLKELGVEPGGPNGLRYYALVDREAVRVAKSEYAGTETLVSARSRFPFERIRQIIKDLLRLPHQVQRRLSF